MRQEPANRSRLRALTRTEFHPIHPTHLIHCAPVPRTGIHGLGQLGQRLVALDPVGLVGKATLETWFPLAVDLPESH